MSGLSKFEDVFDDEFLNRLNTMVEMLVVQGKSIQDLVAEGQLTPTQYATLIKSINGLLAKGDITADDFNKNGRLLDGTFFTSDFLEQLNNGVINATNVLPESITKKEIADKSISPSKADFLKPGINKFDGSFERVAIITDGRLRKYSDSMTAIVPVIGGKDYFINKFGKSNRTSLGWHSSKPDLTVDDFKIDIYEGVVEIGNTPHTAPENAKYMIFYYSFEEGTPEIDLNITEKHYSYFVGYDFLEKSNVKGLENDLMGLNNAVTIPIFKDGKLVRIDEFENNILTKQVNVEYDNNSSLQNVVTKVKGQTMNTKLNFEGSNLVNVANSLKLGGL